MSGNNISNAKVLDNADRSENHFNRDSAHGHQVPQVPASVDADLEERVWSVLPQSIETAAQRYLWITAFAAGGFVFGVLVMLFLVG